MAKTKPSNVRTLIVKPTAYMTKNAPMIEIGIATTGMIVVRQSRRNEKMTSMTSKNATSSVSSTSLIERRMYFVTSKPTASCKSGGRSFLICSILLLNSSAIAT